ncbi:Gfo/Idh/MocA family oxidoreductase [Muricauda sp. SCSIO 64092]|uniref:Gfo/Idh/MocA family protein n=1 Tax=Allomuricauda sp. SCSIO 64092 TaxID=2908842 RepID=UPI001FF343B1|nr:Gfo/Idh/MocA family oxidoreductase [Muricauda sp. SCSIO 64092]UOY08157.1 Gfo/Idh/MocA family oxidoreductase [Muricauda sp. SCSIO 64092]
MKKKTKKQNTKSVDRRSFVKTTGLAGGALFTSSLPLYGMGHLYNPGKLKLAVVGCGGRGTGAVVQALIADRDVELVAMADAFQDRLENSLNAIQEHFEGQRTIEVKEKNHFVGFDAYKKAMDKADVVILATPPGFRPLHFEYAVANDKHVFMEKPVATDPVGVRRVLASAKIAKQKQLNVVVGLQRHYENKYLKLYDEVQKGTLGKIVSGQVYWNSGGVWVRPRTPEQTEMEYQMRNWYYFNWLCGDHILEQHIHNIDVANWFLGEYPVSAQGMGGREVRTGKDHGEIFDHHFVEFTYPSGAVISSQCRHQKGCMNRVDEAFHGTKGRLVTSQGTITDLNGDELFNHQSNIGDQKDPNPYQVEHDHLFAAIRNKDEVLADTENGAKATLSAIMGRMATYSGDVITWEQALNSSMKLVEDNLDWNSTPPTRPDANGNYPIPTPGKTTYTKSEI